MKNSIIIFCFMLLACSLNAQRVGVGTTNPDPSAALDVTSTTQGMLVPRMTTAQRNAISNAANGLLVFDVTTNSFWFKGGPNWIQLIDSSNIVIRQSGTNVYMAMNGNVGIGTSTPESKLTVKTNAASPGITHTDGTVKIQTATSATSGILKTITNHNLQLNANNGSNHLTITPSGQIGIGTAAPAGMLEIIRGGAPDGSLVVKGTTYNSYFNKAAEEHTYINGGKSNSNIYLNAFGGGKVGIGTESPAQALHVQGAGYFSGNVGIGMTSPLFPLHFADPTGDKISLSGGLGSFFGLGVATNLMQFITPGVSGGFGFGYGSSASFTENVRITGDGKVGIGTSSPSQKLDVNGNANVSGGIGVGGAAALTGGIGMAGGLGVGLGGAFGGAVGIGTTTPDPSSMLDVSSTTKGMLPPRMTTPQRDAIPSPAEGLMVYNTTTHSPEYRTENNTWKKMNGDSSEQLVFRNGSDSIYTAMTEKFGIGTDNPDFKLHVQTENEDYGIAHTDGIIEVATYVGQNSGWIGTKSNHPFKLYANDGVNQFVLSQDGNVGIGYGSPGFKLNFAPVNGDKISLYGNLGPHYGFGMATNLMQIHTNTSAASIGFGYGNSFDFTENIRFTGDGKIGIGTTTPHGVLQFSNADNNRKIVLKETADNNHRFIGFGINANSMRYQLPDENYSHNFYVGKTPQFGPDTSNLIMKIEGDGDIGINVASPNNKLDMDFGIDARVPWFSFPTSSAFLATGVDSANHGIELWKYNGEHGLGIGYNSISAKGSIESQDIYMKAKGSNGSVRFVTNAVERMRIHGNGNIGIGLNHWEVPHALLQFNNSLANRKIVLYEATNNDHQFYGFGINGSTLRYQVSNPGDNHVFYAGASPTTSNQLMIITGGGNVGIGVTTPLSSLEVVRGTGFAGTAVFRGTNHYSHFNFGTNEDTYIRGGKNGAHVILNDYAALGNVGIGTQAPLQKLHVQGNAIVMDNFGVGTLVPAAKFSVSDKFMVNANGSVQYKDDVSNLMYMYETPNLISKMLFSHSTSYPNTGLGYDGNGNKFEFTTEDIDVLTVDLNNQSVIAENDMEVEGMLTLNQMFAGGNVEMDKDVYIGGQIFMGYENNANSAGIPGFSTNSLTCSCAPDKKVIGGGHTGINLDVVESTPTADGSGWRVTVNNLTPSTQTLTVRAICIRTLP